MAAVSSFQGVRVSVKAAAPVRRAVSVAPVASLQKVRA
jgi:hypothetical protein